MYIYILCIHIYIIYIYISYIYIYIIYIYHIYIHVHIYTIYYENHRTESCSVRSLSRTRPPRLASKPHSLCLCVAFSWISRLYRCNLVYIYICRYCKYICTSFKQFGFVCWNLCAEVERSGIRTVFSPMVSFSTFLPWLWAIVCPDGKTWRSVIICNNSLFTNMQIWWILQQNTHLPLWLHFQALSFVLSREEWTDLQLNCHNHPKCVWNDQPFLNLPIVDT